MTEANGYYVCWWADAKHYHKTFVSRQDAIQFSNELRTRSGRMLRRSLEPIAVLTIDEYAERAKEARGAKGAKYSVAWQPGSDQ